MKKSFALLFMVLSMSAVFCGGASWFSLTAEAADNSDKVLTVRAVSAMKSKTGYKLLI